MADERAGDGTDAVSPVIGVILMVAITVVMAVVVFMLVNPFTEHDEAPPLGFSKHEGTDTLRLATAPPGLDWSRYSIRALEEIPGLLVHLNGPADGTGDEIGPAYVGLPAGPINGGDHLSFCADSVTNPVEIMIRHTSSNTVVFRTEFNEIGPCPGS